jgi:hypothetical protein
MSAHLPARGCPARTQQHRVPRVAMYLARELAGVGPGDPAMLSVYVLGGDRATRLGRAMEKVLNTGRFEWRLEPVRKASLSDFPVTGCRGCAERTPPSR